MAKEYEVAGTVYEFPDEYTDQQVRDILKKKGVIKTVAVDAKPSFVEEATNALGAAWKEINPWEQLKGMYDLGQGLMTDPAGMAKGMLDAQGRLATKSRAAFETGDYLGGVRHALEYAIPILGPKISAMGDELAAGQNVGENIGEAIGTGLSFKIPGVVDVPGYWANRNPVTKAGTDYLRSKGVPMGAGTASGSKFLTTAQKGASYTPIGSVIAEGVERRGQKRLSEVADELAQTAHPVMHTPLSSGTDVYRGLQAQVNDFGQQATRAYTVQRQAEADPRWTRSVQQGVDDNGNPIMENVAMPVDLRQVKQSLRPIYDELSEDWPIAEQRSSRGFRGMENIMNAPDFVPASRAERGLGGIKELSRQDPEGQGGGLARLIIPTLEREIDAAVSVHPPALTGLREGRRLTRVKHDTMAARDSLGNLPEEGARHHAALTLPEDQRVARLRTIAREVPAEIPKVARGWLEDLWRQARDQGGFIRNDKLFTEWNNLGDETKRILFPNAQHRQDLNNFFVGLKKLGENPNPSGTALMSWINKAFAGELTGAPILGAVLGGPEAAIAAGAGSLAAVAIPGAVAKLMYSPRGIELLTEGTRINLKNPRAAYWTAQMTRIMNEDVEAEKKLQEFMKSKQKAMLPYTYANPALDPRR